MLSRIAFVLLITFLLLLTGRNLSFLPKFDFRSEIQKTDDIKKRVMEFTKKEKGTYSIYYKDLKSGQNFGIDENEVLTGASLNKLIIVGYIYNQAKDGKINLEDKVIMQKEDIQDYGTGSLRYEEPGGSYSLKTLSKLSLQQSDNTAAHLLAVKVGVDKIEEYRNKLGLTSTDMQNNKTTARDMGIFLELLYNRKITSEPLTLELLDWLKDTDYEDRLPRFLPGNIVVYHKTGDAVNMIHDAGIIMSNDKPFVLVILTNDLTDETKAKDNIGKIAKIIYDSM